MTKLSPEEVRDHVRTGGRFRLACEPGFNFTSGGEVRGVRIQVGVENPATGKVRWKDGPWMVGQTRASYLSGLEAATQLLDGTVTLDGDPDWASNLDPDRLVGDDSVLMEEGRGLDRDDK